MENQENTHRNICVCVILNSHIDDVTSRLILPLYVSHNALFVLVLLVKFARLAENYKKIDFKASDGTLLIFFFIKFWVCIFECISDKQDQWE